MAGPIPIVITNEVGANLAFESVLLVKSELLLIYYKQVKMVLYIQVKIVQ